MAKEKKDKKALKNAKKDIWNNYSASEKKALEKLCLNYRHFLSKCKTERECVKEIIFQAQRAGYRDLKDIITKADLDAADLLATDPIVGGISYKQNHIILNENNGLGITDIKDWEFITEIK